MTFVNWPSFNTFKLSKIKFDKLYSSIHPILPPNLALSDIL